MAAAGIGADSTAANAKTGATKRRETPQKTIRTLEFVDLATRRVT
jgi:hypothetical protein